MIRRLIESLTYPRMLMASELKVNVCPMHHYFNPEHRSCRICPQGEECKWLSSNDEFSALSELPIERLYEALLFSIEYVDAYVLRAQHNSRRCVCEACLWTRDARRLARECRYSSARQSVQS